MNNKQLEQWSPWLLLVLTLSTLVTGLVAALLWRRAP